VRPEREVYCSLQSSAGFMLQFLLTASFLCELTCQTNRYHPAVSSCFDEYYKKARSNQI